MRDAIVKWIRQTAGVAGSAILLACVVNSHAIAAGLRLEPTVSLEERWDSNVFSTSDNEKSDFVFRARPVLAALITAFETTTKISGGFEFERYADHTELNDDTAAIDFGLSTVEPLRFTPRFSIRPSASVVETRDTARRNVLITTTEGGPEIFPVETVVTERTRSRDYGASLTAHYQVTPRTDLSVGGAWHRRKFLGESTGLDVENSRSVSGDGTVSYQVTRRFSSGLFFNAGRHTFQNSPTARTYGGGLTGSYVLTEHYTVTARAGVSYLEEDADASGDEDTETAPSGSLAVDYAWQTFQATLTGTYDQAGGGSFGGATRRGSIRLSATKQFAERWRGEFSAYYQNNRSSGDPETVDIDTVQGSAGIRYAAAKWASLRLGGDLLRQRSSGPEGDDIDRESVVLSIDLTTSYLLF